MRKGELIAYEEFYPDPNASTGFKMLRAGMEVRTLSSGSEGFLVRILSGMTKATAGGRSQNMHCAMVLCPNFEHRSQPDSFYASLRDLVVRTS